MTSSPRFLLDEHLRGQLADAIKHHNAKPGNDPILFTRVGDPPDLPLGSDDPTILHWAEREAYILVSSDKRTMIGYCMDHLRSGGHLPVLFIVPKVYSIPNVLEYLVLAAYAADPSEWQDVVKYLP